MVKAFLTSKGQEALGPRGFGEVGPKPPVAQKTAGAATKTRQFEAREHCGLKLSCCQVFLQFPEEIPVQIHSKEVRCCSSPERERLL